MTMYYYGMLTGVGGVVVSMATVAKGTVEWGREGLSLVVGGGLLWSVCCKVTMRWGEG